MGSLEEKIKTMSDRDDTHAQQPGFAANVAFGNQSTTIRVRKIEEIPAVLNDIVDAKRTMLADEAKFVKASTEQAKGIMYDKTMDTEQHHVSDDTQNNTSMQVSPRSKRKMDHESKSVSKIRRQGTLQDKSSQTVAVLEEATDPLRSLGWQTIDCRMWEDPAKTGAFPNEAMFWKDSRLGQQCPQGETFHCLPGRYCMSDDETWTYQYAQCGCKEVSSTEMYAAVVRLVLPARQANTHFKCYWIQVATEDVDQMYCQHAGKSGTAHIVPGGEFALERLRS